MINPKADTQDGKLDVCLINEIKTWKRILNLPRLKYGGHIKLPEVELFKGSEIVVQNSNVLVAHLDGEYIGKPPFKITVLPGKLPVRV